MRKKIILDYFQRMNLAASNSTVAQVIGIPGDILEFSSKSKNVRVGETLIMIVVNAYIHFNLVPNLFQSSLSHGISR